MCATDASRTYLGRRRSILSLCAFVAALSSAGTPQPPAIEFATGFAYQDCETHPHAGVQSSDGGFYMVGDGVCPGKQPAHRYIFAMKTDTKGHLLWQTRIGSTGYNYGKWGIELGDGNFAVAGAKSVDTKSAKCGYIEHMALWVLSARNGSVLSETVFPNTGAGDNLRDGLMCLNPTSTGESEYVATGYVGGEEGECNDDEPMFLIFGGSAFLRRFKYDAATHQFALQMDVTFNASAITKRIVPMMGMRVFEDSANALYGISAATHSADDYAVQFGMVATDFKGEVTFAEMYAADNDFASGSGSHPYSLTTASTGGGWVIAGLALRASTGVPEGRMAKISSEGVLQWDSRFVYATNSAEMSVECYGVSLTTDEGYITTCGTGWEGQEKGKEGVEDKYTWMALLHRTDGDGKVAWQKAYTNQTTGNNAGEFVVTTKTGGYAMYIDANSFGPTDTGGNFGLMVLNADD